MIQEGEDSEAKLNNHMPSPVHYGVATSTLSFLCHLSSLEFNIKWQY